MADLPKVGDRLPLERVFVSKANVNYGTPFGEDEKDKMLVGHLLRREMTDMMKARLEQHPSDGELGYGVYDGRRRLYALEKKGVETITVGKDIVVKDISEGEAYEESLLANLDLFKKAPDPVARAMALNKIMSSRTRLGGVRGLSRAWNIPASTISEWMSVLRLSPGMQKIVSSGVLLWSDVRRLARMNLTEEQQDRLAEIIRENGVEAFKEELEKLKPKKGRGLPKDAYDVDRVTWKKENKFERRYSDIIDKAAKNNGLTRAEYTKKFLIDHIDEIEKEAKLSQS